MITVMLMLMLMLMLIKVIKVNHDGPKKVNHHDYNNADADADRVTCT